MNKIIDKILGHDKSDKGDGDYSQEGFDEAKYREEKYGSSTGQGEAPYTRSSTGEYDDRKDVVDASRDTSGYVAQSKLSSSGEQQQSSSGTTGASSSEYTSGNTGTDTSRVGNMKDYDITGATPSSGLDTTEASVPATSSYTTTNTSSTLTSSEPTGTVGGYNSAIYTIPVEHAGEILPGPAGITGEVTQGATEYQTIITDISSHGVCETGDSDVIGTRSTGAGLTGSSTQGYGETTSTYDSSTRGESMMDKARDKLEDTSSRRQDSTTLGGYPAESGNSYNNTTDKETMVDRAKNLVSGDRDTTSGDYSSSTSRGAGYGDSSALDRGSGANATGAVRNLAGIDNTGSSTSGGYSTERDTTSSSDTRKESLMDKAKAMMSSSETGNNSSSSTDYDNTSSRAHDTSSSTKGAGYGHASMIDRVIGNANATGPERGAGMTTSSDYENTSSSTGRDNTSSGYGTSSTERDTSSGYGGSSGGVAASDEAAQVRAAYAKNEDTYAPSHDQGPNTSTTHNVSGSSGDDSGSRGDSSYGQGQSSYGQAQTSSYGQDQSSYGQTQSSSYGQGQSSYGQTQSASTGLSHEIGGDFDKQGTSGYGSSQGISQSGYGSTSASGGQGQSLAERAEDKYDSYRSSGNTGTSSGNNTYGETSSESKGESLMDRAKDALGSGNSTNSTGTSNQRSGQY